MLSLLFALGLSLPQAAPMIAQPHLGCALTVTTQGVAATERFSLTYPNHWMVTRNSNNYVIIYNQTPPQVGGNIASPYLIKTDASFMETSLREAIQPYHDEPGRVRRIEEVVVNGRLGVRIWEASEGWDFPNTLITYVPVSDQEIAFVASYYSLENQFAEAAILRLHDSLVLF